MYRVCYCFTQGITPTRNDTYSLTRKSPINGGHNTLGHIKKIKHIRLTVLWLSRKTLEFWQPIKTLNVFNLRVHVKLTSSLLRSLSLLSVSNTGTIQASGRHRKTTFSPLKFLLILRGHDLTNLPSWLKIDDTMEVLLMDMDNKRLQEQMLNIPIKSHV